MARTACLHVNGHDYELPAYAAQDEQLARFREKFKRHMESQDHPVLTESVVMRGSQVDLRIVTASISTLAVWVAET